MRVEIALLARKAAPFRCDVRGRYWMAEAGGLFSVALKDYALEPATFNAHPYRPRSVSFDDQFGWRVVGPDCEPGRCWLWNRRLGYSSPAPPREGKAPEWMGGYKAWVFDLKSGPAIPELWTGAAYETTRYAPSLSRLLPAWLFISLTPKHRLMLGGAPETKPLMLNPGLQIPMVLNAGHAFVPVFPELDIPTSGETK